MITTSKTHGDSNSHVAIASYWDEFQPEEVDWIHDDVDLLCNAIMQKYGVSEDEAARQVVEYFRLKNNDPQRNR